MRNAATARSSPSPPARPELLEPGTLLAPGLGVVGVPRARTLPAVMGPEGEERRPGFCSHP
jgi:hypothetical protein